MGRALLIVPIGSVIASVLFALAGPTYAADKARTETEATREAELSEPPLCQGHCRLD